MSDKTLHLDVVSPEGLVHTGKADALYVRGQQGELGILPGHTQLITTIMPGPLRIEHGGAETLLYVSGGILEVQPHTVTILADVGLRPEDLDEAEALKAKEEAEKLLSNSQEAPKKSREDLMVALAKLQVIEIMRKRRKK